MRRFVLRRMMQSVPLLLGISMISFAMVYLAPGNPLRLLITPENAGQGLASDEIGRLEQLYGLDQSLPVQYWRWLTRLVQGDWGHSFSDGAPVLERISELLPATLELTLTALAISLVVAIPAGILAASRPHSALDEVTTLLSFAGICTPSFWLGLMLMLLFSVYLGWLPAIGRFPSSGEVTWFVRVQHMILPAVTLGLGGTAGLVRFTRSSMLEALRQDYIRTAQAKGLAERVVIYRHAFRNALLPLVTIIGLSLPGLFEGAVVVESIFGWPGLGRLFAQSTFARDYPVTMGGLVMASTLVVLSNLVTDVAYVLVDPRIRYE